MSYFKNQGNKNRYLRQSGLFLFLSFLFLFLLLAPQPVSGLTISQQTSSNVNFFFTNITNFTNLQDVPATYSGGAGKCVSVNAGETGLEFITCSAGGGSFNSTYATFAYNQTTGAITYTNAGFLAQNASWLSTYNASYAASGNATFNQTLTDLLYAQIKWNYNQTTGAITYADAAMLAQNVSWMTTFNATYATYGNSTFNQTLTDLLYASKVWNYNQTTPALVYNYNQTVVGQTVFLNLSGTNANQNINILGFNITNTGSGLFSFLGSAASRITKVWGGDIDLSGSLALNNSNVTNVNAITFNSTAKIYTNATGCLFTITNTVTDIQC